MFGLDFFYFLCIISSFSGIGPVDFGVQNCVQQDISFVKLDKNNAEF